jgi:flagellar biosynthetic protein FliS
MSTHQADLAYRRTAAEGASGVGFLIAMYDTLAGDLRRAAHAIENRDIEKRCKEVNHALLVLGYLEEWIDHKNGGQFAQDLSIFYRYLRTKTIEAQATKSAEILMEAIALILKVRGTWQQMESRASSALDAPTPVQHRPLHNTFASQEDRPASSWSA